MSYKINNVVVPTEFLCSASHELMREPVQSICGHSFDSKTTMHMQECPLDHQPIVKTPCRDLQKRIISFCQKHFNCKPEELEKAQSNQKIESSQKKNNQATAVQKLYIHQAHRNPYAHEDDIHDLALLTSGNIVSGSKDNRVKIWDPKGQLYQIAEDIDNGYNYWVNITESFENGCFATGSRDGLITIYDNDGNWIAQEQYLASFRISSEFRCKPKNKNRINCITEVYADDHIIVFMTGTIGFVQKWVCNLKKGYIYQEKNRYISPEAWVSNITMLPNQKIAVAYGKNIEIWEETEDSFTTISKVKSMDNYQYNDLLLVSAMTLCNKNQLAASSMLGQAGAVEVFDIEKNQRIQNYKEHKNAVWTTAELASNVIASGSEDKLVKLWDIRKSKSLCTLPKANGRVPAILGLNYCTFVSASCPSDHINNKEQGTLTFWDVRKTQKVTSNKI